MWSPLNLGITVLLVLFFTCAKTQVVAQERVEKHSLELERIHDVLDTLNTRVTAGLLDLNIRQLKRAKAILEDRSFNEGVSSLGAAPGVPVHTSTEELSQKISFLEEAKSIIVRGDISENVDKAIKEIIWDVSRLAYFTCGTTIYDTERINAWKDELLFFMENYGHVVHSVGRIEVARKKRYKSDGQVKVRIGTHVPAGTGFMIGSQRILTNWHVAEQFVDSDGSIILADKDVRINFAGEHEVCNSVNERIVRLVEIIDHKVELDVAVFRIESDDRPLPPALQLDKHHKIEPGHLVAVIGYPQPDPFVDWRARATVFEGPGGKPAFYIKRFQPGEYWGELHPDDPGDMPIPTERFLKHDASTLAGNSGSPVVDIRSGQVIGIHHAGVLRMFNIATKSVELLEFLGREETR